MISCSITLSTTIWAPDILDKYGAWLRALSDISEPSCGTNIFSNLIWEVNDNVDFSVVKL